MKTATRIINMLLFFLLSGYGLSGAEKLPGTNEKKPGVVLSEEECSEKLQSIKKLLSTKLNSDLKRAVKYAVKIPFDSGCNRVHYHFIESLISLGYYPERYNSFIKETMGHIEDPSLDYRTTWCLRYISSDGKINKSEWDTALGMVKKGKVISLPVYFRYLFTGIKRLPVNEGESRLDDVMGKVNEFRYIKSQGPAGLLFAVIKGLNSENLIHYRLINWILNKYSKIIPDTEEQNRKTALIYLKMYSKMIERDRNRQLIENTLSGMISFLKRRDLSEGPARILISTALSLERKIRHTRDPFYEGQLLMINRELHNWICYSLDSSSYMNQREKRIKYVKRNRIKCRGKGEEK
jgi:hypothetical protein